jgi:hypothetical protein
VNYWNCNLANEIEAEVDLYIQHRFMDVDSKVPPVLDYIGNGFEKAGITVLFGGDHGDKNCPISCKLNLADPQQRKTIGNLGYHCPLVQFANVECSKDVYDLMNTTVMPMIKAQIIEL